MNAVQPPVLTELANGILTVVLNRPEAHNAINKDLSNGVAEALSAADRDPAVLVVILRGAGGKAFSAGADLKSVTRGEDCFDIDGPYGSWGLGGCTERATAKPLIAAVDGIAYGGGFEIALAADILVASTRSRFALPEVKIGLVAGAGGAVRLPRQLPQKIAMDLLLTGEPLGAERAHTLGLVSRLTAPGEAYAEAERVARTIAAQAPLAIRTTKKVVLNPQPNGLPSEEAEAWALSHAGLASVMASYDAAEGARAFGEKRIPKWIGA